MLQRARLNQNLAPWERALLRLGEGLLVAALVAGIPALVTGLQSGQVNWQAVATAAAIAGLMALLKFVTAQGDPPLSPPTAGV